MAHRGERDLQGGGEADEFLSELLLSIFGGSQSMRAAALMRAHRCAAFDVGEDGSVTVTSDRDASDVVTRIIIAG